MRHAARPALSGAAEPPMTIAEGFLRELTKTAVIKDRLARLAERRGESPDALVRWSTAAWNRLLKAEHKNLAKSIKVLGEGHRGHVRSEMPQLEGEQVDKFVDMLQALGVNVVRTQVAVGDLQPTQKHMDTEKVRGMAENAVKGEFPKIADPVVVSNDDHILDGHHRWAALRALSPKNTMKIIRVDLPIDQLVSVAKDFSNKRSKFAR